MPDVISDTSPLQYLYQTNLLDLLPTLYQKVLIPQAVFDELEVGRIHNINLPDVAQLSWIEIHQVNISPQLIFAVDLGLGEREVLSLATQVSHSLALLDDALARQHAKLLNIPFTGTLGVLLRAKKEGHLNLIAPVLNQLDNLRFRLDVKTHNAVLKIAGE
ncbi:MAG: DUF3368 domain-containing protein [Acidobacteriota bacterium]